MGKISLLLVDDHAVVRAGYRHLIGSSDNICIVGESDTAERGCQLYFSLNPDVVLMDLSLPGMTGLEAIRRIISRDPFAAILAFTIHDESAYVKRALEAGAKGYLTKSCDPALLLKGIKKLAKGEQFIDPSLSEKIVIDGAVCCSGYNATATLSPREFDIYNLLIKGHTTQEIAESLFLSQKTVANYATSIKAKLGVKTIAEMTMAAVQSSASGTTW